MTCSRHGLTSVSLATLSLAIASTCYRVWRGSWRGVIEAYTAKKVLPRLLIGAALINLSFYIVIAFVDIMNIVGLGIYSLMSSTVTGEDSIG